MKRPDGLECLIVQDGAPCAYCADGRHNVADPTDDCRSCGFLKERDRPYMSLIPCWKEGFFPTEAQRKQAYGYIRHILSRNPDKRPGDYPDGIFADA